jgi:hypothetical protein
MPLSAVQISNLALARIGIQQSIDDLEEASAEARACNLAFGPCRDELLEGFPWPFANRTAVLGLVAEDPTDTWAYAYRTPSDCLIARSLGDDIPFAISGDSSGGLIYANIEPATLEYTASITDPGLWPVSFGQALAWRVALDIAPGLARTEGVIDRVERSFRRALADAQTNRFNEPAREAADDAEAIRDRE